MTDPTAAEDYMKLSTVEEVRAKIRLHNEGYVRMNLDVLRHLESLATLLEEREAIDTTDYLKLREWFADHNRQPASVAFTAGWARNAATAFEESGLAAMEGGEWKWTGDKAGDFEDRFRECVQGLVQEDLRRWLYEHVDELMHDLRLGRVYKAKCEQQEKRIAELESKVTQRTHELGRCVSENADARYDDGVEIGKLRSRIEERAMTEPIEYLKEADHQLVKIHDAAGTTNVAEIIALIEAAKKLPETADGVPVAPGSEVWRATSNSDPTPAVVSQFWEWSSDKYEWEDGDGVVCWSTDPDLRGVGYPLSDCYSTRAAALAVNGVAS